MELDEASGAQDATAFTSALLKSLALEGGPAGGGAGQQQNLANAVRAIPEDTQVIVSDWTMMLGRRVDEQALNVEIEALKRLHEMSEQTMARYRPTVVPAPAVASSSNTTSKSKAAAAASTNDEYFLQQQPAHRVLRFKNVQERLDIKCDQFPDITSLTLEENRHLAEILAEMEAMARGDNNSTAYRGTAAAQITGGVQETSADRQRAAKEAFQNLVSAFQKNVLEVEKLIERAKNKEFIGVGKEEEETLSVSDLIRVKDQAMEVEAKKAAALKGNGKNGISLPTGANNGAASYAAAAQNANNNASEQAAAYAQLTANYGKNAKKQDTRGRKSLRQIAEGLQRKIELYKTSQVEMEMFQKRVETYIDELRLRMNNEIIHNNKLAVKNYRPEARQEIQEELFEAASNHRAHIKQKKANMEEEAYARKTASIARKEELLISRKMKREEREERDRLRAAQHRWLVLSIIGSRLYTLQKAFRENHINREIYLRQNHAAIIIQRKWRAYHEEKMQVRRQAATRRIQRAVINYLPQHRKRMKEQAANLVREFFQESTGVSHLMKVIKKYRFNVILAQNTIKKHLAVRDAQLELIKRKWEALEPVWWAKRSGEPQPPAGRSSADNSKKKTRKSKKKDDRVYHIPDDIKMQLIAQDLLARKKEYTGQYWQFRLLVKEWSHKFRQKLEMTNTLLNKDATSSSKSILGSNNHLAASKSRIQTARSSNHQRGSIMFFFELDESARAMVKDVIVPNLAMNYKTGYPKIMNFVTLPDDNAMLQMIEEGFLKATSSSEGTKKAEDGSPPGSAGAAAAMRRKSMSAASSAAARTSKPSSAKRG